MKTGNLLPRSGGATVWVLLIVAVATAAAIYFLSRRPRDGARHAGATPPASAAPRPAATPAPAASPSASRAASQPAATEARPPAAPRALAGKIRRPGPMDQRAVRSAGIGTEPQRTAAEALAREIPGAQVQFDAISGAPSHIMAAGRFLAGATLPGAAADAAVSGFIDAHAGLFGHTAAELKEARITRSDVTAHSGLVTRVWQQQLDGVPLYKTILKANLTQRGELVALGSHFLPDAAAAAGLSSEGRAALLERPPLGAREAIVRAAADLWETLAPDQVLATTPPEGVERRQRFDAPGLSDVSAGMCWLPMSEKAMRLGWDVTLMSQQLNEMFQCVVDAQTGEVLVRSSLTEDATDASYRVYADSATKKPLESPTPMLPGTPTPSGAQPPVVPRSLVTLQSVDPVASPNGWINDGVVETLGNNVQAHTDTNADNLPDLPRPTSATRVFDFPLDLTLAPGTYRDAAVTHLFYMNNWMHDQLYALGFTETAGNFQTDNFGRGGLGNDPVLSDAQDGSGTDNANMSTPSDGSPPRMQMYVFTGPTPDRDGDFDNIIVLHEYTHGLSNRLVGGGVSLSALASRGMGEGWSDFYGLALLSDPASDTTAAYPGGAYATYLLSGMTTNHYFGIRRYPYSTDMTKNPLTLRDIDPSQASPHTGIPLSPRYPSSNSNPSAVHGVGEVWCVTLWECRARLIAKYGPAGNQRILRLVTDAMKLSPANPNFLQSRDSILQADLVSTGGVDRMDLWAAFAKRGMGASAFAPPSSTTTGVVEAFDLPDDLSVSPAGLYSASGPVGGPYVPATQTYSLTNTGSAALTWTASATQPWLAVAPAGGTLAPGASATVLAAFRAEAGALPGGTYTATIDFTNVTSGARIPRAVRLASGEGDSYTELFDTTSNDTDNQSWLFTPNGSPSYYAVTRTATATFPTDPTGGTALPLSDDTFVQVTPGTQVSLYGSSYSTFFVGSNGYVTFGSGTSELGESLDAHFALPRIAALFDDLNPGSGGAVSWRLLADRVAVTWQSVPEFGSTNSNSFQIEMFLDGRLRITCLGIAALDGLIGLSRGLGIPAGFVESDFSAYGVGAPTTMRLTLPATATEGAGVLTGQGVVTLPATQPGAVTVTLLSSTPSEAAVPASVTVGAGQLSATFNVTIGDDAVVDGPQTVIVSATAGGFAAAATAINVLDNEAGGAFTLTAPATATEGAGTVQVTLTASITPAAPLTVTLASSDTSEVQTPGSVVIPPGRSSVTFPVTIVDDTAIDGTQSASLTASLAGWTAGLATIGVLDNESATLALGVPVTIYEGSLATGTVTIPGIFSSALSVALSSDTPARLTVPATVTIPAGATAANFTITAVNNALTDGSAPVTVTATASGFVSANAGTTVLDNDLHHYALSTIASPQTRGVPFGVTVTAKDVNDVTIATYAGTAALSASGVGGPVPVAPASTTAFTAGVWTGQVAVNAFATGVTLTASDGAGHTGASNAFTVGTGALHHFAWAPVGDPQPVNAPFPVTVTAQDAGDNVVTSFTGTVALSGREVGVSPAAIVITEANPNTPDEVEFMNVGAGPVNVSGWQIYLYDNTAAPAPLAVFTIPAGSICAEGEIFRLQESGVAPGAYPQFFTGGNIDWTSSGGSQLAVLLRDSAGNAVDFLCAAASSPGSITVPQTIPAAQWSGASVPPPGDPAFGYLRIGNADANAATDWTTGTPGLGAVNPDLTVPFGAPVAVPIAPVTSGNFIGGVWSGNVTVLQGALGMQLRADDAAGHVGASNRFDALTGIFARSQTVPVAFNTPAPILLTGVDPLNPAATLTFAIVTPPAHGALSGTPPNVTYTPASGFFGTDSFTFTAANGATVSAPGTVTLEVEPPPAEISVEQPSGTLLTDGVGTVDFGTTSGNGAPLTRTFTIRNVGGQPLTLTGITGDGAGIGSYSFPTLAGLTIAAGGSASFTATLNPTSLGQHSATLRIGSDDADENPFDIGIVGTVIAAPEIAIEQPAGSSLVDDSATVSFGDAVLGVPVVRHFTIRNVGLQPLSIGSVAIVGTSFSVSGPIPTVLPIGGSATVAVTFSASSAGAKAATLRVLSDDLDEASFDVRLIGIGSAPAGLLRLARDINATGAGPGTTAAVLMGGTIYFAANTADTGTELWRSDGTAAGTSLVRDISAGTASSSPANFRVVGGTLFFTATTPTTGVELWKTDGTTVNTVLVRDIFPGITSSTPTNLTDVAGTLFFSATDSTTNGIELWRSDGNPLDTEMVMNINPLSAAGSTPTGLTAVGATLFFAANDGSTGIELWMSDGSSSGTAQVADIASGTSSSSPANLVPFGAGVLFSATDAVNGIELWTSNGSSAGTRMVRNISATGSSSPTLLTVAGGVVFFSALDSTSGRELWKTDGTTAGTLLVRDINPGTLSSLPGALFAVGSGIYFAANDGVNGAELWKSDGTAGGTVLVADINPGTPSSSPTGFTRIGDTLYFSATSALGGSEVWMSDTLAGTTELLKDVNPGAAAAAPAVLMNVGGRLVFVANDGVNGREFWSSDGSAAGTRLMRDLTPGSAASGPLNLRVLNRALVFNANDGVHGAELWTSNGLSGGTELLLDINPGPLSANPGAGVVIGSTLYFAATDSASGSELWKTDGTPGGTVRVKDIFPGSTGSNPTNLARVGNTLFFSATDSTANGAELWKSDGTETGTVLVANINPIVNGSAAPTNLTDFNGTLYFSASDGTNGIELWRSDGATAVLAGDINPGASSSSPANLRVIGATLFFTATTAASGLELWRSDGLTHGLVSDLNPGVASSSPANLTVVGSRLFFSATTPATGAELWTTTGSGSTLVEDINPGTASAGLGNFMNVNGTLFFSAFTAATGTELWTSDGTEPGTALLKDILPGVNGSSLTAFANIAGTLYFSANPSGSGSELWKSDGTAAGTVQAADIRPGPLGSNPANLTLIGDRLYFSAAGSDLGIELWVLDLVAPDISLEQPVHVTLNDGAATVSFGTAAIGAGGEQIRTFTIRNTAAGALTGLSLSIDGPAAGEFAFTPLTATSLDPGATTTFDVAFAPSAASLRTAALRVASNDPDEAPFDIALSGTGRALTSREAWRLAHFGTVANAGIAADTADADFDGLSNLLEFAFGCDPTNASSGPGPLVITGGLGGGALVSAGQPIAIYEPRPGGYAFCAVFTRRKDHATAGLTYTPEFSGDLTNWQSSAAVPTVLADDGVHQVVCVPYPFFVGGKKARFFRIQVTLLP